MRVLVVGPAGNYPATGFGAITHGSHVRTLGLARALASTGAHVDVLDQDGVGETFPVRDSDLARGLAIYDAIMIAGIAGLWRVRIGGHYSALREHPSVALVVDTVYGGDDAPDCLDFVRSLAVTSPNGTVFYSALRPELQTSYAPWGCSTEESGPNPWPDVRPRVIFAGVVYPMFVGVLNELAGRINAEVWVAGIFHVDGKLGGLTRETRQALLSDRIHLATDILPQTMHGEGPVVYESVCRMAEHATVGLNLVPGTHPLVGTSCKVYDYLGAGLPVVSEQSPASGKDVLDMGGAVVQWGDVDALSDAIRRAIANPVCRGAMRVRARAAFSWLRMARCALAGLHPRD